MHPLPSSHLRLGPCHNGTHPFPSLKAISRSHPRRPVSTGNDNYPHAPLIYWRAVALTGVVCSLLMAAGVVLAVGSGNRPAALTEVRIDDASIPLADDLDARVSSFIANAPPADPLNDDATVAPLIAPNLTVASTLVVPPTPLNSDGARSSCARVTD